LVLGEPEKARAAVVDARRALAGDAVEPRRLDDFIRGLGLEGYEPRGRAMTRKQRRFSLVGAAFGVLALAVALVLSALRESIVFFNSPTDVVEKHVKPGTRIRIGGLVKEGSVWRGDSLAIRFEVTDGKRTVPVAYQGLLPDLFREGQGVVAEGALDPAGTFRADSVLAKHDETYMPKDVADALKKQGHWKDDYEKKLGAAPQGRAQ
jgi:cytochrome c-type biogenesis protein CcmE